MKFKTGTGFVFLSIFYLSVVCSAVGQTAAQNSAASMPDRDTPTLRKSVERSFGRLRTMYFGKIHYYLVDVVIGNLGIPNPVRRLDDGNYLVSGCRVHDCDDEAAVIASPDGTMLAAGIIYFLCPAKPSTDMDCMKTRRLKVFVERKNDAPILLQEMQDWVRHEGAPPEDEPVVGAVEKVILPVRDKQADPLTK